MSKSNKTDKPTFFITKADLGLLNKATKIMAGQMGVSEPDDVSDGIINGGWVLVRRHPHVDLLEKFFKEVLSYNLDLTGVHFPEKEGMPVHMAVPTDLNADEIQSRGMAYFKKIGYSYKTPIACNINRKTEQKRPQGLYVFAHAGGDEPDTKHLYKSYDTATVEGFPFLNHREYLLCSLFHRYVHGYFMDRKGWTRTSSLWSDGHLVRGYWSPRHDKLYLNDGLRDYRYPDNGPRELFWG